MTKLAREPLVYLVAAAIAYCALANNYHLFLIVIGATTIIVGVGLNVLIGLTGQVSFGHVGFYAIGAYAVAILTATLGWSFWIALPLAALLAALVGAALGLAALRVSGPYLAMVTIAFGFIIEFGAVEWRDLTGGANGLMNIPRPHVAGTEIGDRSLAFIVLAFTALSLIA